MKKKFLILILTVVFLSFASAEVNEYNYFKLGEVTFDGELIETDTPVSGVNVKGFVCSDADCSDSHDTLWGGELYTSESGMNLVYPTFLQFFFGYGFWTYKDGYFPYWAKDITWYGEGDAPDVTRYLLKKQKCVSDISILDVSEDEGELTFKVKVVSPVESNYGLMYVPSEVVPHFKSLIDINVEVRDADDVVVWSDAAQESVTSSDSATVSFSESFEGGDYVLKVFSSLDNEVKCLDYDVDSDSYSFNVYDNDKDDDGYTEDVDCDDYDPTVWSFLTGYVDADGDDYGVSPALEVCSGYELPVGYADNGDDCDDSDFSIWRILTGFRDVDGDGYGQGTSLEICSGLELPFGYSNNNIDCDDENASIWQILAGYFDGDGDKYGVDPELDVCSGDVLFGPYASVNGDCDDGDLNVNPGALEICDDGVDNDCDGYTDEGCNDVPLVYVSASPLSGIFPLEVSFSCQGVGGNGDLEYLWDFGNGDSSELQNPQYTYLEAGNFSASCTVSDEDGDEASAFVEIEVGMQELKIDDLVCFDRVIEGHNQSCSVYVDDALGASAGGVDVDAFYSDGSLFGSCLTDDITGACGVKDLQDLVAHFEVYAVASKSGYLGDDDGDLRFNYDVLEEKYNIVGLSVYNDSGFVYEDYDFFRGEDLFVKFSVEDLDNVVVEDDLISNVSLVSSLVGGRIGLERIERVGNVYYYHLIPIPTTHEFLGDSSVFAFVFDIIDEAGGQEEVSLMIRNNLPVISSGIPTQSVLERRIVELDLGLYESDIEDSGDDLAWEVVSFGSGVDVNLVGKVLFIEGISEGDSEVVVRLFDLDGDYDEQAFDVAVGERRSSGGDSNCFANWECSVWSDCFNGIEVRVCEDSRGCGSDENRPLESRDCSVESAWESSADVIGFGGLDTDSVEFSIWWVIVGVLALLILLILFLIFLLLRGK